MTKNVFQIVNEKVLTALENGVNPWCKPWVFEQPNINIVSEKQYSLFNTLCLTQSGAYGTMKQWNELGGRIRKGSKADIVCFWKINEKGTGKYDSDGNEIKEAYPILRYYNVFNIRCVDFPKGVPAKVQPHLDAIQKEVEYFHHERIQEAEDILKAYTKREGIKMDEWGGDRAYYSPSDDEIHLPKLSSFPLVEEYYSTKAHECIHSTGHEKRLNRGYGSKFGSKSYAREELVAEMGATYLMNLLGIETKNTFDNSVAYLNNWKQVIKEDERAIVVAAGKAQKAVEFLLGCSVEEFEIN